MNEITSRWDRVNSYLSKTVVPVNYVALVSGIIVVCLSLIQGKYDFWFWFGLAILLWALVDVIKWRRRKRLYRETHSVGPEDSPDWK